MAQAVDHVGLRSAPGDQDRRARVAAVGVLGAIAAAVIAPLCAACILGPVVIASMLAGVAAWLGGFDATLMAGLVLVAIAVLAIVRKPRAQRAPAKPAGEMSP